MGSRRRTGPPLTPRAPRDMRLVYHRRRAFAATGVLVVLWLVVQGTAGLVGWIGGSGGSSESAAGSPLRGDTAPHAAVMTGARVEGEACPPPEERFPEAHETAPRALTAAVDEALAHRSFELRPDSGVSIWLEGYGEVAAKNADTPLTPASNQKILTAMGALELLDHDRRLRTELRTAGEVSADGVVEGDLYVVGGGDPLIKRHGPHSLEDLAARLADSGISAVAGDLLGDESRYDHVRKAPGWLSWEMPLPGGSMSALMVNSNSRIGAPAYLENPTRHNVDLVAEALEGAGIEVRGGSGPGTAPEDTSLVFAYESATIGRLVQHMLRQSDNMTAELLAKEIGLQAAGEGSTEAGLAASVEALESSLCVDIDGVNDDASGISRDNVRTARGWRELLQAARDADWFGTFRDGLPVAGDEDGTLALRFLESEAEGDVRAKTGTIGTAVALSGYLETDGERPGVFSVVVNGSDPEPAVAAMDRLVIAVAADDS